jgi:hypothetical protein
MKKILVILVLTLFIASALQATGLQVNNEIKKDSNIAIKKPNKLDDPPANWLEGSDQKQTENEGWAFQIWPPYQHAQEFKPTKDKLTAVALEMFKFNNPPTDTEITVSIREQLNGSDLTTKTRDAKEFKEWKWYLFDFEDIDVIPEKTYYIVCHGGAGDGNNAYAWLFGEDNKYDRGIAWGSEDNGETWYDLELYGSLYQVDFCFITYYEKPNSREIFKPFFNILEKYLNQFPILQMVFQQLG